MSRLIDLKVIESFDPDGMETRPTEDDYRVFKSWVLARYGPDMWEDYSAGGWDDRTDGI